MVIGYPPLIMVIGYPGPLMVIGYPEPLMVIGYPGPHNGNSYSIANCTIPTHKIIKVDKIYCGF